MISKLAYVSGKAAKLGARRDRRTFCLHAADDVVIGDGCWIGPGAVIDGRSPVGQELSRYIRPPSVAGIPQDLKFKGEYTTAEVGDNTTIRESVTISRGTAAKGKTVVGSNVLLMAYVHVGHDCVVGDRCVLANRVSLARRGRGRRLGDSGRPLRRAPILAYRRACDAERRVAREQGRAAVREGGPQSACRSSAANFDRSPPPARLHGRARSNEIQEMFRILFQSGYAYSRACEVVETRDAPHGPERDLVLELHPLIRSAASSNRTIRAKKTRISAKSFPGRLVLLWAAFLISRACTDISAWWGPEWFVRRMKKIQTGYKLVIFPLKFPANVRSPGIFLLFYRKNLTHVPCCENLLPLSG